MASTPARAPLRFRQRLGWVVMMLSIVQVVWWAQEGPPVPLRYLVGLLFVYTALSLPGLIAAWYASRRRGREPLVILGALYPLGAFVGLFPFVVTGVLWLVAAVAFPSAVEQR
ncbi:MAG: hypothetical protein M3P93_04550 [Actinomycetota bacterium]|nr:hypothetical protein [Actinomycetota bacterium]